MNGIYSLSNRHAIVFRTIAKKTLAEWKEFAAANPGGDGEDDDFPAVNTSDKYDPDDYVNVYRLRKNSEQRRLANPELLYNFARYSVQLVDLLKRTHFKDEVIDPIDYISHDGRFSSSAHDCQVPTPTSPNQAVEQQMCVFGITKSRNTNASMLELMHQEQTNSSIAWKIEIHNS
jgi:hypothetical protein